MKEVTTGQSGFEILIFRLMQLTAAVVKKSLSLRMLTKIRKIWGKTVVIIIGARPSSQRGWVWKLPATPQKWSKVQWSTPKLNYNSFHCYPQHLRSGWIWRKEPPPWTMPSVKLSKIEFYQLFWTAGWLLGTRESCIESILFGFGQRVTFSRPNKKSKILSIV